jgi:hypothetical protein
LLQQQAAAMGQFIPQFSALSAIPGAFWPQSAGNDPNAAAAALQQQQAASLQLYQQNLQSMRLAGGVDDPNRLLYGNPNLYNMQQQLAALQNQQNQLNRSQAQLAGYTLAPGMIPLQAATAAGPMPGMIPRPLVGQTTPSPNQTISHSSPDPSNNSGMGGMSVPNNYGSNSEDGRGNDQQKGINMNSGMSSSINSSRNSNNNFSDSNRSNMNSNNNTFNKSNNNERMNMNNKQSSSNSPTSTNGANTNVLRDNVVEDFRSTFGKTKQWNLKDLTNHIVAFCQDQHGSRFIQQKLEICSDAEKQMVFDEIFPSAQLLMTDVFGNYVLQKLFEYGTRDQCEALASLLKGQAVQLSMQMYGCRVVQKALEYVGRERLVELVGEFDSPQVRAIVSRYISFLIGLFVS